MRLKMPLAECNDSQFLCPRQILEAWVLSAAGAGHWGKQPMLCSIFRQAERVNSFLSQPAIASVRSPMFPETPSLFSVYHHSGEHKIAHAKFWKVCLFQWLRMTLAMKTEALIMEPRRTPSYIIITDDNCRTIDTYSFSNLKHPWNILYSFDRWKNWRLKKVKWSA